MAHSEHVLLFTDEDFDEQVLKAKGPVLVDFWAEWCGPCLMLEPVIEEIAGEQKGKAKVGKLNVDENPAVQQRYRVMSIPTVLVFRDGKVVKSLVGVRPKAQYSGALAEAASRS